MLGGLQNIGRIPELRQRILFTFGMLAVYRVGCVIVTPGINPQVIRDFFEQMSGTVFGLFSLFSGGAIEQLSVFSLGIMPYISATIIFQLLTVVIPQLEALKKEGEQGQKKINQWSRYATVVLAGFQSLLIATALEGGQFGQGAVVNPGWGFKLTTMITLTCGTAFIMWLGEQVTERGIGNGISLIIFSGIIVRIPSGLTQMMDLIRNDQFSPLEAILLGLLVLVVLGLVVLVERAQRRIPIQHARRVVGSQATQGGMSYFPLRVNTAGVIPPIFASSLLMFPVTMLYNGIYVVLIIFFCYFYTAIIINPTDVSENIKRFGGYIPGIRPGKKTAEYIDHVLSRLTLVGALYVSLICVLPVILSTRFNFPFYFGGTAVLICVSVALDTVGQVESHLVSRQYEGLAKGTRIRGRLGR